MEDKRLSQSQSVGVTHLRSVAYGLSRAQYQSDDVTREVEFSREMNSSQYNAFNNELHWKVFLYREKTQVETLCMIVTNLFTTLYLCHDRVGHARRSSSSISTESLLEGEATSLCGRLDGLGAEGSLTGAKSMAEQPDAAELHAEEFDSTRVSKPAIGNPAQKCKDVQ